MTREEIVRLIVSNLISIFVGIFIGEPAKLLIKVRIENNSKKRNMKKIYKRMPELIEEMRLDFKNNPCRREFVLLSKSWLYSGDSICYYYEEHEELKGKIDILLGNKLIEDITYNNTLRYKVTEDFFNYLMK